MESGIPALCMFCSLFASVAKGPCVVKTPQITGEELVGRPECAYKGLHRQLTSRVGADDEQLFPRKTTLSATICKGALPFGDFFMNSTASLSGSIDGRRTNGSEAFPVCFSILVRHAPENLAKGNLHIAPPFDVGCHHLARDVVNIRVDRDEVEPATHGTVDRDPARGIWHI